jgi:hypothetical protein
VKIVVELTHCPCPGEAKKEDLHGLLSDPLRWRDAGIWCWDTHCGFDGVIGVGLDVRLCLICRDAPSHQARRLVGFIGIAHAKVTVYERRSQPISAQARGGTHRSVHPTFVRVALILRYVSDNLGMEYK